MSANGLDIFISMSFAESSFRIHVPDLMQLSIREAKYKHAWRRYFSIRHNGSAVLDFSYFSLFLPFNTGRISVPPLANIPCNVILAKAISSVKAIIRFHRIWADGTKNTTNFCG